ncbi:hypothetical protein [[Clostridium] aminophilum]|uniref:RloB-like protein n=1 Tax=[Clostridium] aminophilum TaxID=1526 RepID=A0A1I6IV71_9FIRM|nr:hypothetical protein [[Clostridium] aminophilum]SFR70571.1 hypothetical protein SAMN02910262_00901 [[Clostridium] aminophilum]
MKTYVWCEDSGAGYEFWRYIFKVIQGDAKVESKGNNTELRKSVEQIGNDGAEYYVIMDMAVDNPDVLRELKRLNTLASGKHNVHILKIHSFEFVLLSFKWLEDWVFAKEDELKKKREKLLKARRLFLQLVEYGLTQEERSRFLALTGYDENKNSEQMAAALLRDITRNTGFETNKGKLGECFVNDCCTWENRQKDDICGLNDSRLDSNEKINQLVQYSVLRNTLQEVRLL